jgi:hypothetical protein
MNRRILAAVSSACLLIAGAAPAAPKLLENIPLVWSPTSTLAGEGPLNLGGALLTRKIHLDLLVDTRKNPALIAENRENEKKILPVTTSDSVAAFVTQHLGDMLQKGGLTLTDGPVDVTISGEIRDFFVTESPSYHGSVSLVLHARNAKGKEIWSGNVEGEADRFGRSYKAQNYYEVIADMVIKASYRLMDNPEFQKALGGG